MEPEYVAAAIGAVPGLIALGWNVADYRHRKRVSLYPLGLREALLEVQRVTSEVESKPRDRKWAGENVRPLRDRLQLIEQAAPRNRAGRQPHGLSIVHITIQLSMIDVASRSVDDALGLTSPAEANRAEREQTEAAKEAQSAALRMLQAMPPEVT